MCQEADCGLAVGCIRRIDRGGWALALKASDGFTKPAPTLAFIPLYLISAVLLGLALKSLPVGTGYAVWVGIGAVGSAMLGVIVFGESAGIDRILPIGLIAIGVVWLVLGESA